MAKNSRFLADFSLTAFGGTHGQSLCSKKPSLTGKICQVVFEGFPYVVLCAQYFGFLRQAYMLLYIISISIRSKYSLNIIIHHYPYRYNVCRRNDCDSVVSISGTGSNQRGIELAGLLGSFIPKYWPVTLQKSEIGKNRKYIFLKEGKILVRQCHGDRR